jgi:hypothetical protein
MQLADLQLSTGVGGFLLARASCEMLCEAMAAAWVAGRAAPVRRLMLLPQGGNSARVVRTCHLVPPGHAQNIQAGMWFAVINPSLPTVACALLDLYGHYHALLHLRNCLPLRHAWLCMLQVTALAMGRLYAKLEADKTLGQLLLPLLADLLTSSSRAVSTRSTTGSIAGLALAVGAAGAASSGTSGGADSASAAASGQAHPAEVAGAVVCALEGMASVCVQRGRDQWLYEQSLQLLMTMYREPGRVS